MSKYIAKYNRTNRIGKFFTGADGIFRINYDSLYSWYKSGTPVQDILNQLAGVIKTKVSNELYKMEKDEMTLDINKLNIEDSILRGTK